MPLGAYGGEIFVINTSRDVKSFCDLLQKEKILGFDTETRPTFQKGVHHFPLTHSTCRGKSSIYFSIVSDWVL